MNPSRNEPCPCGSGLKFKKCCGKISDNPVFIPPIPYMDILPIENCGKQNNADHFERHVFDMLRKGNLPQAEILLRGHLEREPNSPKALNFLGWIAAAVNLPQFALQYFSQAVKLAPDWQIPRINLDRVSKYLTKAQGQPVIDGPESERAIQDEKFLLIKAWGCGFWADVSHVLGQLLVAELTGRTPIVHWGSNSLFGDGSAANAFEFYFDKFSDLGVVDLQREDFDFWPPKWNPRNLLEEEKNIWTGPFSRVAGLYLLSRTERVVVSDFYTSVIDLKAWIPSEHHLYGLSVDALWLYLVRQYLHPKKEIVDAVDSFYEKHLASHDFIAVHARGSDKALEVSNLGELNKQYKTIIDRYLTSHNCQRIFLMTDDARILAYFKETYGNKIIATDCQRTSSAEGIHYQTVSDRWQLGTEVMVDAYLAAQAKAFVGNGFSNPSLFVRYLKDWPKETVSLVGQNSYHTPNTFLHNW